jgi:lysophospholipase L1-like esterase
MGTRGVPCAVVTVLAGFGCLFGCLLTGCSTSSSSTSTSASASSAHQRRWSVVALGDSVPHGTNCDCTPYPPLSASGLATASGQTVAATNDAVAGYTTEDVLHQLRSDPTVIDHVRSADVVEIEIGANDVAHSEHCGTNVPCYAAEIPTIQTNLDAIVGRVHELTSGHKALVVLLDYWSVWLGGQYAATQGDAYVDAVTQVTDDVNTIIKSTAAKTGSAYVDLRAAFKGPDYAYDETHYLSSDGDHPNAAGHRQIAAATQTVIESVLHI